MEPVRLRLEELPEDEVARRAADVLRQGGIALLPAEGVYGFHAWCLSSPALERIQAMKGRGDRVGFIGLIERPEDAARWARIPPEADALIRKHWPGALTIVFDALPAAPPALYSETGTIALRCPGSSLLRGIVRWSGGPLLSTSANASGQPAAVRVEDAPPGMADLEVDGGMLSGAPSTLVRVSGGVIHVIRQGAVTLGSAGADSSGG